MMSNCFQFETTEKSIPIRFFTQEGFKKGLLAQSPYAKQWAASTGYLAAPASVQLVPDASGQLTEVWCGVSQHQDAFWQAGQLSLTLPEGVYRLCLDGLETASKKLEYNFCLAFGLGSYQFSRYRKPSRRPVRLAQPKHSSESIEQMVNTICWVRDLINTPAEEMGPSELAIEAKALANEFHAHIDCISGEDLLARGYPAIHAVGRASDDPPQLLDIRWGKADHPKLTLVGKGVCFDTGGLDLKSASGMQLMKKDMGGAAHVLGLARLIMFHQLPVRLRVLVPAVENAVSGSAYRPSDVITMRSGKTVEVGNTDAEGRLVLADALTEAVSEQPDLLVDIATLTGAARVAVGTELSAFFCDQRDIVQDLMQAGETESDPLWRLPLYAPYRETMTSTVADLNSVTADGYAGAIIAALFLREFVPQTVSWIHFDLMAWNTRSRPGRPVGGEAMAIRALFAYFCQRYAHTP